MNGEIQNRFVFVAPMWNASSFLPKLLHSICGQSYDNWKLIIIDDISNEIEKNLSSQIINDFKTFRGGIYSDRIVDIWNSEKKWEVENVLNGISLCVDNDIICRIDADDWLVDIDALMILNSVYNKHKFDVLWTAHRWEYSERNISGPMPPNSDPYKHPWVSSHLKTFRKYLLNDVKRENFCGEDDSYIRMAGDQAIMLPALYHSKKYAYYPRVMYHYTIKDVPETYQTTDALYQRDCALFLRKRGYVK